MAEHFRELADGAVAARNGPDAGLDAASFGRPGARRPSAGIAGKFCGAPRSIPETHGGSVPWR
jgi:hypothetical protein